MSLIVHEQWIIKIIITLALDRKLLLKNLDAAFTNMTFGLERPLDLIHLLNDRPDVWKGLGVKEDTDRLIDELIARQDEQNANAQGHAYTLKVRRDDILAHIDEITIELTQKATGRPDLVLAKIRREMRANLIASLDAACRVDVFSMEYFGERVANGPECARVLIEISSLYSLHKSVSEGL